MPTDPLADLRRVNLRIDHITRQLSRTKGTKVRAAVLVGERDELKEERARLLRAIREQD
tara:strand:- start:77 stop:253 length:177 start_codon:yes stop_codon:yes gene_type:complete